MELKFIGCGDAFGSGGRFNTCFMVTAAETRFLVDCGASSMIALAQAGVDPDSIERIVLTHLHGDHFGGLPFFLLHARNVKEREKPLIVAGPPTTRERLDAAIEALFPRAGEKPWGFDVSIEEYELEKEWTSGPIGVTAFRARHHAGEGPACALRIRADGKTLTYSGDGSWSDGLAQAAAGVDLFVAECYGVDHDMAGSGHMHLDMLRDGLKTLEPQPKRVILTHFSEAMLARLDGLEFETASDRLTVIV